MRAITATQFLNQTRGKTVTVLFIAAISAIYMPEESQLSVMVHCYGLTVQASTSRNFTPDTIFEIRIR